MRNGGQLGKWENMEAQGESQPEVSRSPAWGLDFVWLVSVTFCFALGFSFLLCKRKCRALIL